MPTSAKTGTPYVLLVTVLALLAVFPPVATDMYLSGLDQLAHSLGASDAAVELSLSLFFLGLCVGQLIMGPAIDGFGRKGPLIVGIAVFTVTSVALLLVGDVTIFNGLRAVQAIGACAGMVVGRAMVTDLFEGREAAKTMTVLVMLMTIGPVMAPFVGSLFLTAWGWQSIFVFMVILGLASASLSMIVLPETLPKEERGDTPFRDAFKGYARLVSNPRFLIPAFVAALVQAAMFAFITASAGIFKSFYGLDNMTYGLLFGLVAASLAVFSHINTRLLNHYSPEVLLTACLPVFALLGGGLFALSSTQNLWVFVVPLWFAIGFVGLLSANAMSIAMEAARGGAGVGSALLGACQFAIAFLCSTVVALMTAEDASPMAIGIFVPALAALALWFAGRLIRPQEVANT
ncbi:multidrug effflux MFS transporter [Labrenzia sp. CE80]|uniref:multidrug effflux MFS transporter n=1 Tax=Labrenzia sp. CE80 TaxID=1788986 RepID=UPI00129AA335|nr:multidrug effflux MFS transporter [Labrenzia sp. CE80]